jgi:hypothetical protein
MANFSKFTVFILAISIVALLSGCICCCGLDSNLSKFKKSVSAINFPSQLNLGGKIYNKAYSNEYLGVDPVKAQVKKLLSKFGYSGKEFFEPVDAAIGTLGIQEYKSFKYTGPGANDILGGLVAKTSSPIQAMTGYQAGIQTTNSALPAANDPYQNTGNIQNIHHGGSIPAGDGGDQYSANVEGKKCYVVICRYSNMYVAGYSYESYDKALEAVQMAIQQIDNAA